MRFSKTLAVILGIVIFGAGFALLYMEFQRQRSDQTTLKAQIAANQASVSRLTSERENWQAQLNKLNEQLDQKRAQVTSATLALKQSKTGWPTEVQSIEYDETLFGLANGWNLDIVTLAAGGSTVRSVNGLAFQNTTFTVSVTSPPLTSGFAFEPDYEKYVYEVAGNILGFLDSVSKEKSFATATIDGVNITLPQLLTKDDLMAQGTGVPQPTATFTITVYTYTGA